MIDIFWATTKRIFVPRTDMTLVQASPEIRELNLNTFRLALKDLEAAAEGMPWPDTHRHTTETTLSGFVYARFVEILAPYFVEFEDGTYAVRAVGANSNLLDRKISNQVSVSTQNSAGLLNNPSASVLADAVLDEAVYSHQTPGSLGAYVATLYKVQYNRLEVNVAAQELILYDDDGVTPLKRWPLETTNGEAVITHAGVQTKRKPSVI